jgi:aryl-alcohol dehydrogenase-like predicted oxidoreductase
MTAMEMRRIGSLEVTVVGLGCNNFGTRIDERATHEVVNAALDAGINFLDTADIYGKGLSEEFIGRALEASGRRDEVVLASKFGKPMGEGRRGAHPAYIRRAVEDSLRRLRTDRIDLYQQHEFDADVPLEDTLGALDELVREGKVREIGSSNFTATQVVDAERIARARHAARFVSVQNEYSLLEREPERGMLDECARVGAAFLPYYPLAAGLLSGKYHRGEPAPAGTRLSRPGSQDRRPTIDCGAWKRCADTLPHAGMSCSSSHSRGCSRDARWRPSSRARPGRSRCTRTCGPPSGS